MKPRDLIELSANRLSVEDFLVDLRSKDASKSAQAGKDLLQASAELGLPVDDYIRLAVDPYSGTLAKSINAGATLDGWDLTKIALGLPVRDDFQNGTVMQAAGETFQTFPGVRAMFPQVIDDVLRFRFRQDNIETVDPMLASTRTISGPEMLSTIVEDAAGDYDNISAIAEGSRVPIHSIKGSEYLIKIWKYGMGYKLTYEFSRRASLDVITPYATRVRRRIELGKVKTATATLVSGDGVNGAATVVNQSTLVSGAGQTTAAGSMNFEAFLAWLVSRAKNGTPVDTVVGNWDTFLRWQLMFAKPMINMGPTGGQMLQAAGVAVDRASVPGFNLGVRFAVSSTAPANQLIGFSAGDTMEQLIEAGSQIEDSTKAIENQTITYVMTENAGFRLVFGDTRSILNLNAVA
jgi:hypothetical protein